eukprot:15044110-Ditylum_brightwellii.AAC.1
MSSRPPGDPNQKRYILPLGRNTQLHFLTVDIALYILRVAITIRDDIHRIELQQSGYHSVRMPEYLFVVHSQAWLVQTIALIERQLGALQPIFELEQINHSNQSPICPTYLPPQTVLGP